jgi:hypothetical protein
MAEQALRSSQLGTGRLRDTRTRMEHAGARGQGPLFADRAGGRCRYPRRHCRARASLCGLDQIRRRNVRETPLRARGSRRMVAQGRDSQSWAARPGWRHDVRAAQIGPRPGRDSAVVIMAADGRKAANRHQRVEFTRPLAGRTPHCTAAGQSVNGAAPRGRQARAPVAQWLEPAAHNGLAAGSNPAGIASQKFYYESSPIESESIPKERESINKEMRVDFRRFPKKCESTSFKQDLFLSLKSIA